MYTVWCEGLFDIEILCERTKVSVETVVAGVNVGDVGCLDDGLCHNCSRWG